MPRPPARLSGYCGRASNDDGRAVAHPRWRVDRAHILGASGKAAPLGGHRRRVDNRRAMDAILFARRTGGQWHALNATGICASWSAHRHFQASVAAGVFAQRWAP